MNTTNPSLSPDEAVLCDLLNWIDERICVPGPYNNDRSQLQFRVLHCYEATSKPTMAIDVYRILAVEFVHIGMIAPIHNEDTNRIEGWMLNRKTNLGYFVETSEGPIPQVANSAVNFFLVDPDVIKRCYESNQAKDAKFSVMQYRKEQEDGINEVPAEPVKPVISKHPKYEIDLAGFYEVLQADMGKDKSELGKVLGIYELTNVKALKGLHFECFVSGNEYQNWVQCLVMEPRGKFPRIYGSFRMNDTYAVIESRFFKGAVETCVDLGLVDVLDTYVVKPHANYGTK